MFYVKLSCIFLGPQPKCVRQGQPEKPISSPWLLLWMLQIDVCQTKFWILLICCRVLTTDAQFVAAKFIKLSKNNIFQYFQLFMGLDNKLSGYNLKFMKNPLTWNVFQCNFPVWILFKLRTGQFGTFFEQFLNSFSHKKYCAIH